MHYYDSNKRECFDLEFELEDESTYIVEATYNDGSEVPEHELEYLTEAYADVCDEKYHEFMIGRAEAFYEGDR